MIKVRFVDDQILKRIFRQQPLKDLRQNKNQKGAKLRSVPAPKKIVFSTAKTSYISQQAKEFKITFVSNKQ